LYHFNFLSLWKRSEVRVATEMPLILAFSLREKEHFGDL
jgi:hypothetical protein